MKAQNALSGLDVSFVSLVHRAAVRDPSNPSEPHRFTLTKSEVPVVDMTSGATNQPEGGRMPKTETELRAALEKAEQENAELRKAAEDRKARKALKKAAKAKPTDANPDPDHDGDDDRTAAGDTDHDYQPKGAKMSKSEDLQKAEERFQKAEERAAEAEKIAKEERDLRVRGEYIQKAETEFSRLGDPKELGPRLHRMSEQLSKEDFDAHLDGMRATQAQLEKADRLLMGQIGVDGSPTPGGDDVKKAEQRAEEIRKADPNVDSYEAMRRAVRENPDLILANR